VVERGERAITVAVATDSARTFTAWHTVAESVADAGALPTASVETVPPSVAPQGVGRAAPRAAERAASAARTGAAARREAPLTDEPSFASSMRERPAMQQRAQQPRITVAWNNTDIRDVLAAFAAFAGRTIIVGRNVAATVTAEIIDQPWDVAMQAILASQGLAATQDASGIIVVDTYENIAARRTTEPLATRTIRLNYVRAQSVAENLRLRLSRDCTRASGGGGALPGSIAVRPPTLTEGVTGGATGGPAGAPTTDLTCPTRGAVTADTLTNAVSVTDVPGNLEELLAYARELDIRQPQVSIKAKIVLVDRTSLEALGLRYDIGSRNNFFNTVVPRLDSLGESVEGAGRFLLGGNALAGVANASQSVPNPALTLIYSAALGRFDFTTFLDALQEISLLDVQSEPSVVALNNRTARLQAGVEVPIRVIEANAGGAGEGNFPRATVNLRQTGVILTVTPQITANRQIIMRVEAENSDVDFRSGDVGAVFPTQKVTNEMLVADGETAVMGGLTQTRVSVSKTGIPLLVDLPIIGRLFGVTTRQETKRDLLILITPHIVDDGQTTPGGRDER